MSYKKREDENDGRGMFFDKTHVLQLTRVFNETPLNARKSRLLIAKVLSLLYAGEVFTRQEATNLFFSTTKLFQNKDPSLRQMIYLIVKELSDKADDVIMVTSSLTKDINARPEDLVATGNLLLSAAARFGFGFGPSSSSSNTSSMYGGPNTPGSIIGTNVSHRACAIRALCRITDPSMLAPIERFLKQAIVDKNPSIASAALVSSYHLVENAKDLVRRWANEIQEAFTSNKRETTPTGYFVNYGYIVQYHALGLLYLLKQQDRMAVVKLLQTSTKHGTVRSQWAQCMLIRFAQKCCEDESAMNGDRNMIGDTSSLSFVMYEYLKSLCSNNDMVMLEAARALCNMVTASPSSLTASQVQPAIQTMQHLLTSPKPTLKFAALRTLNRLAHINPTLVASCNLDIEALITDPNRSVATFAITTLLKTGTEAGVDRLMKQISSFMNEISDEFKVIVIDAIRVLAVKFPSKHTLFLNFLNSVLREEGGYEYKKSVVDAIFDLTTRLPECMETALPHLCEFIEDCEFTKLAVRILHLLGVEGPKTKDPAKFLRYIYNRVILENSNVRAAAVNALASFGCQVASLRDSTRGLLSRCLEDPDDEVRDRATFTLGLLDQPAPFQKLYVLNETVYSLSSLQTKLDLYQTAQDYSEAFDTKTVAMVPMTEFLAGARPKSPVSSMAVTLPEVTDKPITPRPVATAPSLDMDLGQFFKSSSPVDLTEKEMEYFVQCIKHVYSDYIVFQFNCTNTLPDALLSQVHVHMVTEDMSGLTAAFQRPAEKMLYQEPASVFVGYKRPLNTFPLVAFQNTLKYIIQDCDKITHEPDSEEGFDDEYEIESIEVSVADYMLASAIPDFNSAWESMQENQIIENFVLPFPNLVVATQRVIDILGMQPLEQSEMVSKEKSSHTLLLSGMFITGISTVAKIRMIMDASEGVIVNFGVAAENRFVSEFIAMAIQG